MSKRTMPLLLPPAVAGIGFAPYTAGEAGSESPEVPGSCEEGAGGAFPVHGPIYRPMADSLP